eukprot:m.105108 g.105108  ORF g.105108 m.105108 type:complete len:426 (-) comp15780_c0_seq4:406-1683(-)
MCGYAGCNLSREDRQIMVPIVTTIGAVSFCLCLYVLVVMQAFQRYRIQSQRLLRAIFGANVMFAFAWANPYHHYAAWPTVESYPGKSYCVVVAYFQMARFLSLLFELRLMIFAIYCAHLQRTGFSARAEFFTYWTCWLVAAIICVLVGSICGDDTQQDKAPSLNLMDDISIAFFCGVFLVGVTRLILYCLTRQQTKLWKQHNEVFKSAAIAIPKDHDEQLHDDEVELPEHLQSLQLKRKTLNKTVHEGIVKPLQWYPVIFMAFILPQVLIVCLDSTDLDEQQKARGRIILQMFVPMRGTALFLLFYAGNANICHWRNLKNRLKLRYASWKYRRTVKRNKIDLEERLLPDHEMQEGVLAAEDDLGSSHTTPTDINPRALFTAPAKQDPLVPRHTRELPAHLQTDFSGPTTVERLSAVDIAHIADMS